MDKDAPSYPGPREANDAESESLERERAGLEQGASQEQAVNSVRPTEPTEKAGED